MAFTLHHTASLAYVYIEVYRDNNLHNGLREGIEISLSVTYNELD